MTIEIEENPAPGWYAVIEGHQFDLDDWCIRLKPPFDPAAIRLSSGRTLLRSTEFEGLETADEVRERASAVVARMNGALRLSEGAHPVHVGGVSQIAGNGTFTTQLYAEGHAQARARAVAEGIALGPNGKPTPQPPPKRSEAQEWNSFAKSNEVAAKLLDHYARADNWGDIYKTAEFCEKLLKGVPHLKTRWGAQSKVLKGVSSSANYHRHARTTEPIPAMTLDEAKNLLTSSVRIALRIAMEQ